MHIFHFGLQERKLFGCYFPPLGSVRRSEVVVIAGPWGWEAIRAHRTIRMLAVHLQKEGFGVLRFDYFGSGDSFGEDEDADLEGWTKDLEWALEEARALAGRDRAILIGLRLGAFLSGRVAARFPSQIAKVVFWEPVLSGSELIRDWTGNSSTPTSDTQVNGFVLPRDFARDIQGLSLLEFADFGSKVTLARSVEGREPPPGALPDSWRVLRVPGPQTWKEERDLGAGAAPVDLLRQIVACLS